MSNYTPLDLGLFIREGDSKVRFPAGKRDAFDKLFFPFSLLVLILSLSFYAIRLVIDITGPSINQSMIAPTKAPSETINEFRTTTTSPSQPTGVYQEVNGVRIDTERLLATAEAQYPSLSRTQLIDLVNKSLVEWAALKQYYEHDNVVEKKLSLNISDPVATFGAVLRDLGILAAEYDKSKKLDKKPISALVDTFTQSSKMR